MERDPRGQYPHLELGLIAARTGHRAEAVAHLRRAAALNPRDEITRGALRKVLRGQRVDIAQVNKELAAESENVIR